MRDANHLADRNSSTSRKAAVDQFPDALDMGDGTFWKEIVDFDAAKLVGQMTRTAVAGFYAQEAQVENGAHPRRWFAMFETVDDVFLCPVVLCVLPPGVEASPALKVADCHITGRSNEFVFPAYSAQVAALADAIGIELPENHMGVRLTAATAGTPSHRP